MTEQTIPAYGASINIENSATVYLRERALDVVEEQVVADANDALERLNGRGIMRGSDLDALRGLHDELVEAKALVWAAFEIALSKRPTEAHGGRRGVMEGGTSIAQGVRP
jgi:hypothetical protein